MYVNQGGGTPKMCVKEGRLHIHKDVKGREGGDRNFGKVPRLTSEKKQSVSNSLHLLGICNNKQ